MERNSRVLLIGGPESPTLEGHIDSARRCGLRIAQCTNMDDAAEHLSRQNFDAVLLAPKAEPERLHELKATHPHLPVLALTSAIEASRETLTPRNGIDDYLVMEATGGPSFSDTLRLALRRAAAAKSSRHAERRQREFYENLPVPAYALDLECKLISANPAMVRTLGYDSETALLAADEALFADPAARRKWIAALQRNGRISGVRRTLTSAKGHRIRLVDTVYLTHDEDGTAVGYQGSAVDVTKAYELSRKLAHEASHDALTTLVNRREFSRQLTEIIADDADAGCHALCYFDLDQFKVVNDTCGHPAGDELLRQLSAHIAAHITPQGTLARLGGDEFALLLRDCDIEQAAEAGRALLTTIRSFSFQWQERQFDVRASIGVVPIDGQTRSVSEILGAADAACYAAKEKGRNRVQVQEPDDKTVQRRISEMHLVVEAKHALSENRMKLFQQQILPVTNDCDARMHFEVLIRMQDWDGEFVAPGVFLPAVERYNLSRKVDRWVLTNFLQWITQTPGAMDRVAHASINLSGMSVGDAKFLQSVCNVLDEYDVPGEKLCFEVTETAAVQNLSAARHFIETLKERGCRFALDDFGSGLSSFGYLKNFPVDFLKIDGMFIRGLRHDATDRVIVKSVNDVAHSMGLLTIAEFVEDDATLQIARDLGIDFAQGYAIGRPAPLDDLFVPAPRYALGSAND